MEYSDPKMEIIDLTDTDILTASNRYELPTTPGNQVGGDHF